MDRETGYCNNPSNGRWWLGVEWLGVGGEKWPEWEYILKPLCHHHINLRKFKETLARLMKWTWSGAGLIHPNPSCSF